MVKPHNGPSAVLVLNATGHNVVQDANAFSVFWLNGFPTGFLVDWWKRWSSKKILGAEDPQKLYTVVITMDPLPHRFWVQRIG